VKRRSGPRTKAVQQFGIAALCLLSPVLMGGCPSIRNELIGGFEATVRSVLDVGLTSLFQTFLANDTN